MESEIENKQVKVAHTELERLILAFEHLREEYNQTGNFEVGQKRHKAFTAIVDYLGEAEIVERIY